MIGERREARTKSQAQTQLSFMEMNKGCSKMLYPLFIFIYPLFVSFSLLKGFIRWFLCSLQLLENEFLITESIILSCVKSLFLGIVHSVYFY